MSIFPKLCKVFFVANILLSFNVLFSDLAEENRFKEHFLSPPLESLNISDWKHPTHEDYNLIQQHLKNKLLRILASPESSRPFGSERLNSGNGLHGWITYRLGRFKMIEDNKEPIYKVEYLNNDPKKKDKCIICYASYNMGGSDRDYAKGIDYIKKSLIASKFEGHFIYRVGGWPNLKQGRLKYADVPYAFKPFFFEEVKNLGYKRILWVDSASVPVKSVAPIFKFMKKNGCCFFSNGPMGSQEIKDKSYVIRALDLPERDQYTHVLSQVVGFDLNDKKAAKLLKLWIKGAKRKVPFLEPSADQLSFAFLVNELGLLKGKMPDDWCLEGPSLNFTLPKQYPNCIIYHQYDFLNPDAVVPDDLFSK